MKIKHPNKLQSWFIKKMQSFVWKLENTGDTDIENNGELKFIQKLAEESGANFIFFDIGANNGEYTDLIKKYLPTTEYYLHLFEPQQSCFTELEKKYKIDNNIFVNNFGLSNTNAFHTLYKNQEGSGLASLYQRDIKHYNIEMNLTEKIELNTASDYIAKNNIKKINLIKIDVEGHELDVLKGFGDFLTADTVDFIQFEYGGANLDSRTSLLDLFNYFTSKGFILCKIMRHGLTKHTYQPRFENFMYQNWVAVSPRMIKQ